MREHRGLFVVGALLIGSTQSLRGQLEKWEPIGPPRWTATAFATSNGITYFVHTSWLTVCQRVTSGPVERIGTNLSQVIETERWTGPCIACADCRSSQTQVSSFGELPDGKYVLNVYSYLAFPAQPSLFITNLFAQFSFSVPVTNAPSLTLTFESDATNRLMLLSSAGLTNRPYCLQVSSDLTNWTGVFTNHSGPFALTQPIVGEMQRFFRVVVIGN